MKIAIIGIGSVGAAVATAVAGTGLAREIVLYDRDTARARASAADLGHATTFCYDIKITPAMGYSALRGSDVVIIAAGANQKPGETRMDLVQKNATVIRDIVPRIMPYVDARRVKIIIVTNPLDVMVMLTQKLSRIAPGRVIGTGTMLDSARLRTILSRMTGVSTHSINAYVLGEHGDSSVINWTSASVGAVGLDDFARQTKMSLTTAIRRDIDDRVRHAAYEIIQGRGATWDGIGAAVADLIRCIARDERRLLTVSIMDPSPSARVAMSMPRVVGIDGVTATLRPKLSASESAALRQSGRIIRTNYDLIK